MFRLPSLGGQLIDEILKACELDKKYGINYFNQVSTTGLIESQYRISLVDDRKQNELSILGDQFVFKKTAIGKDQAVNIESAIEEFKFFWKVSNKMVSFPETRRIGIVGEYRIKEIKTATSGVQLLESLTKLDSANNCTRFNLSYELRGLASHGGLANVETDDFWNEIYSYYISELDETPEKGAVNANMDIQKYFNPAKSDPIKELKEFTEQFKKSKDKFKSNLVKLGLAEE
jgi:hypothetical protein